MGRAALNGFMGDPAEAGAAIFLGDCTEVIARNIPAQSVNMIVTSPPYADQRSGNYGGIHPDRYVEWFLPKARAFKDCLAPDGSFVLNIKEKAVGGEKHPYVYDLVLALRREQDWRLVDEYCWHKRNCYPGKWPNRFRDSWERLYHFALSPKFKMRQEEVMVPCSIWPPNAAIRGIPPLFPKPCRNGSSAYSRMKAIRCWTRSPAAAPP